MRRLSVVVADADRDQLIKNTNHLSKMAGIDIIRSTMYGEEVIEAVYSLDVDVVVTDIVLKGIDGIGVLDAFCHMDKPTPKKLILTRMSTAFVQEAVFERGASFFMTKPTTPGQLYERIRMLGADQVKMCENTKCDHSVSELLRMLGISPEMKGYAYLSEAASLCASLSDKNRKLTECVYPAIAKKFSTSAQSVERAIRTCIQNAWKTGAIQKFALENANAHLASKKPTAGEMIEVLSGIMKEKQNMIN
ncbi:MAG: response regulator [Clostridiales bacterium]|nr:response regulator [Clostridiales bacterium]